MRFFNNSVGGEEQRDKETDRRLLSQKLAQSEQQRGGNSSTNVIWVHNPLVQLISSDGGTADSMPAATLGGAQHPSNEDCGIRDVWAHNLEDEFRTIRQVNFVW